MIEVYLDDATLIVSMVFSELTVHSDNKNVVGSFYFKKMMGE